MKIVRVNEVCFNRHVFIINISLRLGTLFRKNIAQIAKKRQNKKNLWIKESLHQKKNKSRRTWFLVDLKV